MKPSRRYIIQLLRGKIRGALMNLRQDAGRQQESCVDEEIGRGAIIGCTACIVIAWEFSPLIVSAAAMLGLCFGALIGLVLWGASARLPDQRVVPPAPGMQRYAAARHFGPAAGATDRPADKSLPANGRSEAGLAGRRVCFPYRHGGNAMRRSKFGRSTTHHLAAAQRMPVARPVPPEKAAEQEITGPREVIEQAARDIQRGLRDTDQHGIPSDVPGPGIAPERSPGADVPLPDEADGRGQSKPPAPGRH